MHADNAWLAAALAGLPALSSQVHSAVHFQYAFTDRAEEIAAGFARHGIGVRELGAAHGVRPGALRIVAPRRDEREHFAAALADVT